MGRRSTYAFNGSSFGLGASVGLEDVGAVVDAGVISLSLNAAFNLFHIRPKPFFSVFGVCVVSIG